MVDIRFLRGTTVQNDNHVGNDGTLSVDTTNYELRLHDGATKGGHLIARLDKVPKKATIQQWIDGKISDYDSGIQRALSGKVDQESGKSLTSNDFTTAFKDKLSNVEAGAQKNKPATKSQIDALNIDASSLGGYQPEEYTRVMRTPQRTSLPVGWYTVAVNGGNRAIGRFGVRDTRSGRHQSVSFYASHHYGRHSEITVFHSGRYSAKPIRHLRIKRGGTYDGALLQIYIEEALNEVTFYLYGENFQDGGWVLKNWVADGTDPGGVGDFPGLTSTGAQIDIENIVDGGMATTGKIYAGGQTTQHETYHEGNVGRLSDAATTPISDIQSGTTKSDVGLGNVDNTSDATKPISTAQQAALSNKLNVTDIVDGLTSVDAKKTLSAAQGKALKTHIDNINTVLQSNDGTLDELQEVVDYIKLNRSDLDALGISSIAGLVNALAGKSDTGHSHTTSDVTGLAGALSDKVSKVTGKGLSDNNYTSQEKQKLSNVEAGAQKNVGDTFNVSGNYVGLRARGTTKADVGLGNVRNVASYSQSESDAKYMTLSTNQTVSGEKEFVDITKFLNKGLFGNRLNHPSVSNVVDLNSSGGVNAFRALNLIDDGAMVKIVRTHDEYGAALELFHWDDAMQEMFRQGMIEANKDELKVHNVDGDVITLKTNKGDALKTNGLDVKIGGQLTGQFDMGVL